MASEVWRHGAGDVQIAQVARERERPLEEARGRAGLGHGDCEGSRKGKLVSPERKRRTVEEVRRRLGPEKISERRACQVLGQSRSTQRYVKRRPADEAKLLAEMRRIARRRPRFGSPRICDALRTRGWKVNHKRIERLWREEGMQVPKKQHRKRRIALGGRRK